MEELQRITTVPIHSQRLLYGQEELQFRKERTLNDAGIHNNAQVRLLGDPIKTRYEPMITRSRAN